MNKAETMNGRGRKALTTPDTTTPAPQPQAETPASGTPGPRVMVPTIIYALIAAELPFATLLTLDVSTVDGLAKDFAKKNNKVKEVRDDYKDAAKAAAKVYAALEIRLNDGKEKNFFAATKSLSEYIKDITGEKPPTHALTLKNAFSGFVMSKLITEDAFNANSGNCLELAARILHETKGDLTHDAVAKAAAQLTERSDKEAKNLRDILASVKPVEKLSAEDALEMVEQIVREGHLGAALAHIPDLFDEGMTETQQQENYIAFARGLERLDSKHGVKAEAWIAAMQNATAPIGLTAAGVPTPATA